MIRRFSRLPVVRNLRFHRNSWPLVDVSRLGLGGVEDGVGGVEYAGSGAGDEFIHGLGAVGGGMSPAGDVGE